MPILRMKVEAKLVSTLMLLAALAVSGVANSQTQSADMAVEKAVRDYYNFIKAYDIEGMRSMTTPGFEITYSGVQLTREQFEAKHVAEEREVGSAKSRPDRFNYRLSNFRVEIEGDLAYVTSEEDNFAVKNKPFWHYFDLLVLHRVNGKWLVHRFFHYRRATA